MRRGWDDPFLAGLLLVAALLATLLIMHGGFR
jgi:hypothetical protein